MSSHTSAASPGGGSYLARYDAASEGEKFPLVRRWMDTEPLPFFTELRERRPILVTPVCTLVTRLHDVVEVLSQPKVFTVALYMPKMKDYLMIHDDDALHTREKSIMVGFLNREDLPAVRQMVADIAKGILDAAGGRIDAVSAYSRMVPARLVQDYFGLDGADPRELIEWSYWNQYNAFHNHPFDLISDEMRRHIVERHTECDGKLARYVTRLMVRKLILVRLQQAAGILLWPVRMILKLLPGPAARHEVRDDVVKRMLRTSYPGPVDFDIRRVGINAGGLLIGSVETTAQAVAQVLQFLLDRGELGSRAMEAARWSDPGEFDGFVWEALRFVPIAPFLFRKASQDCEIGRGTPHQTTIPAGTIVLPVTQSAMFDPEAFDRPDEFNPRRSWHHHFNFGFGSHECLGKYVGMVMIPEMVRQVMLRPDVKADGPIDYKAGPFPERYELSWSTGR